MTQGSFGHVQRRRELFPAHATGIRGRCPLQELLPSSLLVDSVDPLLAVPTPHAWIVTNRVEVGIGIGWRKKNGFFGILHQRSRLRVVARGVF